MVDHVGQDGCITTAELIAFFGETSKKADAIRNARYWLNEIDGFGDNTGFITLVLTCSAVFLTGITVTAPAFHCPHSHFRTR